MSGNPTHDTDVDVVVIGSGAGGLTAAVALAQAGRSVTVVEQHDVPGGWCHSFTLGGYRFSPGVHYIGELGEGGGMRAILEGLGVADDLPFFELNPDGYDHVIAGDQRFDIPKGRARYIERLEQRFPDESRGIRRYFDIVSGLASELDRVQRARPRDLLAFPLRYPKLTRYGGATLGRVLNSCVRDPVLRTILSAMAGDHGVAPARASMAMHAAIQAHYFDGGYYPKGGGFAIPRAFVRALKRAGGTLMLKAPVARILVEGRRAVGVRLADGREIRAKQVISNADPGVTFGRLLTPEQLPWRLRRRLRRTRWSISALSLFMAVDIDAEAAGLDSGNYWFSAQPDLAPGYRLADDPRPRALIEDGLPAAFLTVTSLKDPTKFNARRPHHVMESFAFVSYEAFQRWAHTTYGDRPEDYEELKRDLTDAMLRGLEPVVPGIRDRVVYSSLGTPLTNEHYCMATRGGLYGIEKGRSQLGPFAYPVKTHLDGLLMCGASTVAHGVMGATISGLHAAKQVLGVRISELLTARGQQLQVYSAEDPSSWPQAMQRRRQRSLAEAAPQAAVADAPLRAANG